MTELVFNRPHKEYDMIEKSTEFSKFTSAHLQALGSQEICIKALFLRIGHQKQVDILNHKRTDFSQTTLRNLSLGSWIGGQGLSYEGQSLITAHFSYV